MLKPAHSGGLARAQDVGSPVPVTDGTGRCPLTAATALAELTAPDVVVIGGSLSEEDPDEHVMQWLRQVHPHHCLDG